MSTVYWFVTDKIRTEQFMKERENENLKTELSFLRSQVSPHFLFNVLNNMVAMARLKSDHAGTLPDPAFRTDAIYVI